MRKRNLYRDEDFHEGVAEVLSKEAQQQQEMALLLPLIPQALDEVDPEGAMSSLVAVHHGSRLIKGILNGDRFDPSKGTLDRYVHGALKAHFKQLVDEGRTTLPIEDLAETVFESQA